MRIRYPVCFLAVALVACGPSTRPSDGGPAADAGMPDGSVVVVDAGHPPDAGTIAPDAGSPVDAGTTVDAGSPSDAGIACTNDSQCTTSQYCAGTGCGTPGTCASRPGSCPKDCVAPELCGCDGQTYCNECLAEQAGTRVTTCGTDAGAPDAGLQDAGTCASITSQAMTLTGATQSCSQNSDCIVDDTPCHLTGGCWAVVNTTNSPQLESLISEYDSDGCNTGPQCPCAVPPSSAICTSGVCQAAAE